MDGGTLLEHPVNNENGYNLNANGENVNGNGCVNQVSLGGSVEPNNNNPSMLNAISNNPLSKTIMLGGDFEFLRYLTLDELKSRMANLDLEMEAEIEELQRRYAAKRQPILDAMDNKKKRQQNF